MKNENFSQILEISSIFRIFLALFLKISRQFLISWTFLWNSSKISSNFRRKIANFIEKREWKMNITVFRLLFHYGARGLRLAHFVPSKKNCRNFTEMFRKWETVSIFWEKVRERFWKIILMLEISRICEHFSFFISFFHSSP